MPHLHIKEFKEIEHSSKGDIEFGFVASNISHKDEKLIYTKLEDREFFLLLKEQEDKTLLKIDKVTKPATTYLSHRALLEYADMANLEVLHSNVIANSKSIHYDEMSYLKDIEFFSDGFSDSRELRVEVGFGSGRHLLHQAVNNPNILFIGLEIHTPSLEQVLKQINIQNIKNLYLLNYDARLFLEMLKSNSVGRIYVHFPVPWDKKPSRRVISKEFIDEAKRVLMVGGRVELRTDSDNYYSYSYETMMELERAELYINKNKDIAISSKYEDRWKRLNKNIYDLTLVNDEHSKDIAFDYNFDDIDVSLSKDKLFELHRFFKKTDEAFINIERVYELRDGVLLRVAMGSFARPQSIYMLIKDAKARYFAQKPINSKASLVSHNLIREVLNG
ncbi:MAG: tRNA (guanosine(46)-N7)-methyltransferase TrmB [Sulfurimonas sp.]